MSVDQNNQRQNAVEKLEELAENKIELKRPVFFIPGWKDETCVCWESPYLMMLKNSLRSWRRDELSQYRTDNSDNQQIRRPVLLAQGASQ